MKRLPAEWEPQSALLLTWPHPATDWAEQLPATEATYAALVRAASRHQRVVIVCPDQAWRQHVRDQLQVDQIPSDRLIFAVAPSNDTWVRDYGPITAVTDDGTPILNDFRFNAWGGKFPAELDNAVNANLHTQGLFGAQRIERSDMVLEGGAIETDGVGTALLMRRTLIDPARNPGWGQAQIEAELRERLGIRHCLWLEHGQLSGDDTDGHIDTLARLVAPGVICHASCDDPSDPDHGPIRRMIEELHQLKNPAGAHYRLIALPRPAPIDNEIGDRLPAGYANFALINGAVLLPVYQDPADAQAIACLRDLFPDRQIHPIDCRALIRQGGSLHCACMQLPAPLILSTPHDDAD